MTAFILTLALALLVTSPGWLPYLSTPEEEDVP